MPPSEAYSKLLYGGAGSFLNLSERDSDVEIIVESGGYTHRFPAHNLFLRTMSDVLKRMLDSEMSERATRKIIITDSNAATIRQFLRFIYTGEVVVSDWREVADLLAVSHKYQVEPLINICEKLLMDSVDLNIACCLHDIAQLYTLPTLLRETQSVILDGAFVVLATEGFENLSMRSLDLILSHHQLNVENEITVLYALRKWALSECSRRGKVLSNENIVALMKPFLDKVRLEVVPKNLRAYIPNDVIAARICVNSDSVVRRRRYFVPPSLRHHMASLKFVVELGSFTSKRNVSSPFVCIKFSVDVSLFILGFRMVGMFRNNFVFNSGYPILSLRKESNKSEAMQFNLASIPWKGGATVGDSVWKEVVAYFPRPARVDAFTTHSFVVTYSNRLPIRWPRTRLETNNLNTEVGPIVIYSFGQCAGITELFLLPAPQSNYSCGNAQ